MLLSHMVLISDIIDFPAVNAGLNSLCTVLLLSGYIAIRTSRVNLHRNLMISAFLTSTVFLSSYLYYHIVVRHGESTRYPGHGWDRTLYLVILISHILLAVGVAVLAPVVLYLGLTQRYATHRRIARWLFPIWLYVSVTGVIVYLMLYRLHPIG